MPRNTILITLYIFFKTVNVYGQNGETINNQDCGLENKHERIVRGLIVPKYRFPWVVFLDITFPKFKSRCCGSIITKWHVLTAGHCFTTNDGQNAQQLEVLYGDVNFRTSERVKAVKFYRHEKFYLPTFQNDVTIVLLEKALVLSNQVRTICLPEVIEDLTGKTGVVTGWGLLSQRGHAPDNLRYTTQEILTKSECKKKLGHVGFDPDKMICAYENSTDACQGDSGGPFMLNKNGKWTLVGIVSFGIGCALPGVPGIYTNIPNYVHWIKDGLAHEERFINIGD